MVHAIRVGNRSIRTKRPLQNGFDSTRKRQPQFRSLVNQLTERGLEASKDLELGSRGRQ